MSGERRKYRERGPVVEVAERRRGGERDGDAGRFEQQLLEGLGQRTRPQNCI
ncbi:hypothetical protein [Halorussus salinisoli]|uniref:hypothetical protein n=1 Tax=Halorussus salinisoli TaxID=2558242 RepID=UPI001485BD17|nr:hypothetical protein [Halorussus salinisoli]